MIEELMTRLARLDVSLTADGDRLKVNAPKGVLTPELQRELSANKPALLAALREARASQDSSDTTAPLAIAQERLWFFEQFQPGSVTHNMSSAVRLRGHLDLISLERAIAEIVRRHATLRTTFAVSDADEPLQQIHAAMAIPMGFIDLSGLPANERDARADELLQLEARLPFNIATGPLLRVGIIRVAADHHVMTVTMHHIISDGWSIGVFVRELSALYAAFVAGGSSPLPALPLQYAEYARWQREHVTRSDVERQLDYWRGQLGGDVAVLSLPADRPRPETFNSIGRTDRVHIPAELVRRLRELGRSEHTTMFMVLLGAFQVLLARYAGETDIPVGTPIANRTRLEHEALIGLFANVLVLRTDLSGNPTFRDVLTRVRQVAVDAYANQDVPFGRIVAELQPPRDPSRAPFSQVGFSLQNVPATVLTLPGLQLSPIKAERGTTKTDMSLELVEHAHDIYGGLEYWTDIFDSSTMQRMWGHYLDILSCVVDAPGTPILAIPLTASESDKKVLAAANETQVAYDQSLTMPALLADACARHADSTAVADGTTALTYRAFGHRSHQLCSVLRARGLGRGDVVAVCLARGVSTAVVLAGILKAGAAYVPIDSHLPADRIALMLEDAGAAAVVVSREFAAQIPASVRALVLDDIDAEIGQQAVEVEDAGVRADDLAYVMYTSGSTGTPKGVEVNHRNLVSFLLAMRTRPGCTSDDTLLAITTVAFDISGLELWLPLITGAKVVVATREDALDPERLASMIDRQNVTVLQATPATWRALVDSGWRGRRHLRALCGGEAMPRDLAASLHPLVDELWNMYGPTETTIWSTCARIENPGEIISIGTPIANTRVHILDPLNVPVPIGIAGELCIAGDGVTRGYRGRPELTAQRFISVTVDGVTERVYRTGDIARWRNDGTMEIIGRLDEQVKVRGFRIELGEIEAVLRRQPGIIDAVATAVTDGTGARLAAYCVLADGSALDPVLIRSAIRRQLPEYMIPAFIGAIAEIPRTAGGKIDRRSLPSPSFESVTPPDESAMTETERTIAGIWSGLLEGRRAGVHDNFFDVGGHSLLAIKLHTALRRNFGVEFPLVDLFRQTTIATQAGHIQSLRTPATAGAA